MWTNLPVEEREEYKRMILSFASLTEMFAQKAEDDDKALSPIINSKYQETVFQKVFHAFAEDIGNTSYDASLIKKLPDGTIIKYLVGIKTFGYSSGEQKVAQFKANLLEWSDLIREITSNAVSKNGEKLSKWEIDSINAPLYKELAVRIATLRNMRIDSSEAGLQGFSLSLKNDNVQAVYHFLMPSKKGEPPVIYVGETSYDRINIDNIEVLGCTSAKNPANFDFTDGNHKYRYTSADSQLLMDFDNKNVTLEKWNVVYADNAYEIFSEIGKRVFAEQESIESYSWLIENKQGEVERFSGFNGFYGVGSKLGKDTRKQRIDNLRLDYAMVVPYDDLQFILQGLSVFLLDDSVSKEEKLSVRDNIVKRCDKIGNAEFSEKVTKLIFRPQSEMYIPLPNSVQFHNANPDFFGKGLGVLRKQGNISKLVNKGTFTLVFEPSGDEIDAFITQDGGKAIESCDKQSILGEWVLREVFQLAPYQPLTSKRLAEVGLNGIRIWKKNGDNRIHIKFIWIDKDNLPDDYMK